MVVDVLTDPRFFRGLFWAIVGVGFWAGGFVVAYYVWERYRGE